LRLWTRLELKQMSLEANFPAFAIPAVRACLDVTCRQSMTTPLAAQVPTILQRKRHLAADRGLRRQKAANCMAPAGCFLNPRAAVHPFTGLIHFQTDPPPAIGAPHVFPSALERSTAADVDRSAPWSGLPLPHVPSAGARKAGASLAGCAGFRVKL
jgi:hypothetical protein